VQKAYLGLQLLDKAVLEEKPFDFIILDYVMPDMNGVEVATLIRQKPMFDDLKMILATSQPTRSDAEDIKFAGIKGYLIKPLRPLELLGIMALLQEAQEQKQSIDMVTRYTIRERRIGHKKENEKISYQNVNVLVAEDNPVNQEVMMGMLEDYGIKTTIARNGLEAIATLKKYTFDLVFMDCQMPEMDGFEATNIIRNSLDSDKKIIVIALTANVMKGDRDKCIAAGMDDYLAKPINELELEKILVKWLSSEKQSENNGVEYVSSARWNGNTMELTALNKTIIEKLRARMKDRFGKMLETFSQSANTLITRIENGLAEDNLTEASEAAHALKSSGQIGAMVLYNLCVTMEERARAGDKAAVQENVVLARAEYDRILNDIEILKA
jgi:CheY-like chemotaxis protein/HPt (histidine-containing phosphotransfer) domain-containing protein